MPAAFPRRARSLVWTSLIAGVVTFAVVLGVALLVWPALRRDSPPSRQAWRLVSDFPAVIQDQGHSIALPDGRTLWIFADTAQTTRRPGFFVTSSAAVARRGSAHLTYLTDRRGTPAEFLPRTAAERAGHVPAKEYTAVWPTGATTLPDGRILIAYSKYRVQASPQRFTFLAGGLFAYRYGGADALDGGRTAQRIADDIWTAADGSVASPVHAGRYVYFTQCEPQRCYVARVPVAEVADRAAYRWWTGTSWSRRRSDHRPMRYGGDHPGRNPPVAYVPALRAYVTVDTSWGIPANQALLWVAPRPWGPWSRPGRFPLPGCTAEKGCYTLNVHAAGSTRNSIRVSYATAHTGPHVYVTDIPIDVDGGGRSVVVRPR